MMCGNVGDHDCIGANNSMVAHSYSTEQLGPRADIDVTTDHGQTTSLDRADGNLLENEAVRSYPSLRVYDYPIGMG